MFPRAKSFFVEHSESKSGDEFSHDAFEQYAAARQQSITQGRKRNSTNGHNDSPSKRAKLDAGRSAEITDVRERSHRANGVPELPGRPLDRHLVVYRFAPLPLAHPSLSHETAAGGTHTSQFDAFDPKPTDKNFCAADVRERAWRTLVNAQKLQGHPCFVIAASHPMAKWNAHLLSPFQNKEWWLLTKRIDMKPLAMISCYQCESCGSNLNKHTWDGVSCVCPQSL